MRTTFLCFQLNSTNDRWYFVIKLNLYKFFFFLFSHFSIHTLSLQQLSLLQVSVLLSFTCFSAEPKRGSCRGRSNWFRSRRGRSEYLGSRWLRQGCGLLVSQWDRSEFGRSGELQVAVGYGKGVGCWFRSGIGLSLVAVVSRKSQ